MAEVSSWLPNLIGPLEILDDGGDPVTPRATLNFVGATITDDPDNERTNIVVGGFVAPTGTGFLTVTGGVLDAASTGSSGTGNVVRASAPTIANPTLTGTVTYQGTKLRILSIPGEVQTTTATTAVIASFTILDGTSVTFDFVAGMKAVGTTAKAGRWDGKVTYQRNSGGAPAIVGAAEYGTAQENVAGDGVTFDLSGNVLRVLATAADADDRNWTCELRVHETLDDA